ncbi:MAG: periplasmic protein TonB [Sphingomonadales bacterium]|jgi:protein TonB|nr:periplasmic protein TonB [Sphingomonadales bacterium]
MTEGGFYQQKRLSPTGMTVVVLLHGAAIAALMSAKMDMPIREIFEPIHIYPVPVPPPPPPYPVPPPPETQTQDTQPTVIPPIVDPPFQHPVDFPPLPPSPPPPFSGGSGTGPLVAPPPPAPPKFEPARARANLGSYVSNADYPDAAIRGEEQGITRFRLSVGADGRVTDCIVTGSSGSSSLDAATCRLMRSRARFAPARDGSGNPTSDNVASAIRWVLPDG